MTETCKAEDRRILAVILKANALLITTLLSCGLLTANHAGMGCRALGAAGRTAAVAFSPTWGASLRSLPGPLMLRRGVRSMGMKVVSGSGGGGDAASQQQREGAGGRARGERGGGGAGKRGGGSSGMETRRRIGSMDGSGQGRRGSRLSRTDATTRSASTESCNSPRGGARGGMAGRIGSLSADGSQRTTARRRWEVKTKMEAEKRSDSDSEYLDLVAAAMLDDRELEGAASLARDLKRMISPKEDAAVGVGLKEAITRVDILKVLPALESLADAGGGPRPSDKAARRKPQKPPPVESGCELSASATGAAAGPSPPVLNGSAMVGGSLDSATLRDKTDSNGVGSAARKEENLAVIVDFLGLLSSGSPSPPRAGASPIPGGSNQTVQGGGKGRLGAAMNSDAGRAIGGEQLETFIRIVDVLGVLYPNKTQPLERPLFTATQANPSRGAGGGGGPSSPAKGRKNGARKDTWASREAGGGVQGGALGGELFMSTLSRFRLVPASMPTGRLRVPAGLSSITKLKGKRGLLEALRPASENAASLPPADAVIALNQLKRLRPSSLSPAHPAELIDQMDAFVVAVTAGMSRLSPKYIALALNAYIGWEGAGVGAEEALLDRAASRVLQMRDDPVTEYTFPSQSIAMILNAFARSGRNEPELITCLCDAIAAPSDDLTTAYGGTIVATPLITPPPRGGSKSGAMDWNGQNVAVVVNSLVKLGTYDHDVFSRLSLLARRLPQSSFTPQSIGNIVNAFVRAGIDDPPLFEAMHKAAMSLPPQDYNPQAVANIMNACKRSNSTGDSDFFAFLSEVALGLPTSAFTPQSIANIASACSAVWPVASSLDHGDSSAQQHAADRTKDGLIRHLCEATLGQTLQDFAQPQALALALNAFSSLGESHYPALDSAPGHFRAAVKHMMAAAARLAPPREAEREAQTQALCEAWEAAMICNAVARYEGDADLVCCLGAVLLETPAPLLAGIDVANVANAMARLSARDDALLAHLTAAASQCGEGAARGWDVQASANTLNALSRLGVRDETCFRRLADRAAMPGAGLNGRLAGSALNAFARSELWGGESFEALCKAAASADGWDEQAVCNAIHALAMVGTESSRSSQLVDVLCNELQAKKEGGYVPQGIANAAWGLAVLQVRDESVDAWVEKAISAHAGGMDAASCRQISQYIVERRLRGGREQSGKWDAMQRRLRGRIQRGGAVTSKFQRDVRDALRTLLSLDCVEEWEEPRSGYTIDIWLPRLEIGIEVDGPYHYARGTRQPLGSTLLKRRQLRDLGMRVVAVPYWEWEEGCGREEDRAEYLRGKIEQARRHP